jgi:hypothetical protein
LCGEEKMGERGSKRKLMELLGMEKRIGLA